MNINFKILFLYIALVCISAISCKTEVVEIDVNYSAPTIKTENAIKVGESAVILNATISKLNDIEVIEHGFIINKRINNTQFSRDEKVVLNAKATQGQVSAEYKFQEKVVPGDEFQYYYYLRTKKGYYKGQPSSIVVDQFVLPFKSLKATMGETITIEGDFSKLNDSHIIITENTHSLVPFILNANKNKITIEINNIKEGYHGNTIYYDVKSKLDPITVSPKRILAVEILGKLNEIPSRTYNYLDELFVSSSGLSNGNNSGFFILINDYKIPYSSKIKFADIPGFNLKSFKIGYINGRDSIWLTNEHTFKLPQIEDLSVDKSIIHPYSFLIVKGYEFEYFNTFQHALGEHPIRVGTQHFDQYNLRVENVPNGIYRYNYKSEVNDIEIPTSIQVRELTVSPPEKRDYYFGEKIHLKGTFIKNEKYLVGMRYGTLYQVYTCEKDGELITENIFSFIKGEMELRVGYETIDGNYFNNTFSINNLGYTVDDFSPKKGYQGQLITIKGKGVHLVNSIKVGDVTFDYNIQRGQDEIKFIIPNMSIKGFITIGLSMKYDEYFEFKEKFELL
jgi:hypothetical protein